MQAYKLHTLNSFTFRGNGSFQSTEGTSGQGVFPPYPQTIYGALRNNWIEQNGTVDEFRKGAYEDLIGSPTSHGSLGIKAIFLSKEDELYIPLPLDCQVMKESTNEFKAEFLKLEKGQGYESDGMAYRLHARHNKKSASADNMWLKASSFEDLLSGETVDVYPAGYFVHRQPKIGIALDRETGTVKEGMLYQLDQYQFKAGASLVLLGNDLKSISTLTMGRQGSLWNLETSDEMQSQFEGLVDLAQKSVASSESEFLRVTFLSPFIGVEDLKTSQGQHRFFGAEWIAAATGRPQMVGGWDMALYQPKPRYPVLPAGSSYIIRVPDGQTVEEFSERLYDGQPYSDQNQEAGFGHIIVTACDN